MITLEQIKNEYAKVQHYDNWDSLLNKQESLANIEWHYNNIIELAQMECLKLTNKNIGNGWQSVKESIVNENNIIK